MSDPMLAAAELVDDLTGQVERENRAFAEAFLFGFYHGRDIGRAEAEQEIERAWAAAAKRIVADGQRGIEGRRITEQEAESRVRHAEAEYRRMALRHAAEFERTQMRRTGDAA